MHNGILFEDVTRPMADENIQNCIKYICNHFFGSVGFEVSDFVMYQSFCLL